jgi:hypothetical protein
VCWLWCIQGHAGKLLHDWNFTKWNGNPLCCFQPLMKRETFWNLWKKTLGRLEIWKQSKLHFWKKLSSLTGKWISTTSASTFLCFKISDLPAEELDQAPWVGGDDAIQTLGLDPTCCGKSCSLSKFGVSTGTEWRIHFKK